MFNSYSITDFLGIEGAQQFHINRLENMPPLPPAIMSPHKHLFHEVLLIKEGETFQTVDYQDYDIRSSTLFFISQGQLHFWSKLKRETIKGYRMMFTEDFFQLSPTDKNFLFELIYLDNVYQYPCLKIPENDVFQLYSYFDLMFHEYTRVNSNPKTLQSLLALSLSEIQRMFETQNVTKASSHSMIVYKQFMLLVEAHFKSSMSVQGYADALCLSVRQLNRIIQEVTNQSVTAIIHHRIILEAKRLLCFSDWTVLQITDYLGFEDSAYFARFFRQNVDVSPSTFKKEMAEMYRIMA